MQKLLDGGGGTSEAAGSTPGQKKHLLELEKSAESKSLIMSDQGLQSLESKTGQKYYCELGEKNGLDGKAWTTGRQEVKRVYSWQAPMNKTDAFEEAACLEGHGIKSEREKKQESIQRRWQSSGACGQKENVHLATACIERRGTGIQRIWESCISGFYCRIQPSAEELCVERSGNILAGYLEILKEKKSFRSYRRILIRSEGRSMDRREIKEYFSIWSLWE